MAIEYTIPQTEIVYPDSDGQPIAESDFQRIPLTYAVEALTAYFAARPDVYVSANMFIYHERGAPRSVVAPDVFVVFGVPKRTRASFKVWEEEGHTPAFVLEVTSAAAWAADQGSKRGIYALLGVSEYCLVDPTQDYLVPPLQGLRLVGRNYEPMPLTTLADGTLSLTSQALGLDLRFNPNTGELRFFDPVHERILPSYKEAEERAEHEAAARRAAEAELERLREELKRLRGE